MDIYEQYRTNNFMLIYGILILHTLHMLQFASVAPWVSCLFYSMSCLYVGSTRSLQFYNVKPEGQQNQLSNSENSLISLKTALSIPVISTLSLLAAYFSVINQLDFVNKLLEIYFMFVAAMVLKKYLYAYGQTNMALLNYDFPIQFLTRQKYKALHFTVLEFASLLLACYLVYSYIMTKFWVANNIIAIAFTIHCIENWLVGNIKFITLIFAGLILYDVYFVFASDVMMTVAKGVDLPIKLLFPASNGQYGMLGLGDIVIPGLLCSMCIRYDCIQAFKRGKEQAIKDGVRKSDLQEVQKYIEKEMHTYYFRQSLFAYLLGITATYMAMNFFQSSQPALLYILPLQLITYFVASYLRHDFLKMLKYDEDHELDSQTSHEDATTEQQDLIQQPSSVSQLDKQEKSKRTK